MRQYKLLAFIIRSKNFNDADKLFFVYSRQKGKVILKAKGIRKIKSKLRGQLDTLNLVEIEVSKGSSEINIITGALATNLFINLKKDLDKLSDAYFFLDILDKLTIAEQKNENLFLLFKESLSILEISNSEKERDLLKLSFITKLLFLSGHSPNLKNCIFCNENSAVINNFDLDHGGIVCKNCSKSSVTSLPISLEGLKLINAALKVEIIDLVKLKYNPLTLKESLKIILAFKKYTFQNDFASEKAFKV